MVRASVSAAASTAKTAPPSFGSTETAPFCLVCHAENVKAGAVGLPAAGVELKLAPVADKLEARVRGPHITPGYWRAPEATAACFDEEGFYRSGDAGRLADQARPEAGIVFDGRLAENFKLSTGAWVNAGAVRLAAIEAGRPLVLDAVVAGHDRDFIGVLLWVAWRRPDLLGGYAYPRWLAALGTAAWVLTVYLAVNSVRPVIELLG